MTDIALGHNIVVNTNAGLQTVFTTTEGCIGLIGGFALVWIANQYMSLYGRLRLDITRERVEIKAAEEETD